MKIAIDLMGGEHSCEATIPGMRQAFDDLKDPTLGFLAFGPEEKVTPLLKQYDLESCTQFYNIPQIVQDTDHPYKIFQTGLNTTMGQAIAAVQENAAECVVSSGSTGGYIALCQRIFGLIPGINKIALPALIPVKNGLTIVLDLGASLNVSADDLVKFAIEGNLLSKLLLDIEKPRIGLLNVGTEDVKGLPFLTEANRLLKQMPELNYAGFVEGTGIFSGNFDVIVTDGYAGNIALKTIEGTAQFLKESLKDHLTSSLWTKFKAFGISKNFRSFQQKFDKRQYNGAVLLGLSKLAIKSHGDSDSTAFANAIKVGYKMVKQDLINSVTNAFPSSNKEPALRENAG